MVKNPDSWARLRARVVSPVEARASGKGADQRRLARAIWTEQRQQLPLAQCQAGTVEDGDGAKGAAGVGDGEDIHARNLRGFAGRACGFR